jgi:hypothetical protein
MSSIVLAGEHLFPVAVVSPAPETFESISVSTGYLGCVKTTPKFSICAATADAYFGKRTDIRA